MKQKFWPLMLLPAVLPFYFLHEPSLANPPISVFGHKVPDTDAICAAVAYAWELNARNFSAAPFRLGELNRETAYVLQTIGIKVPLLLDELTSKSLVAIVDTRNPAELPVNFEKASIHSIVDHHKFSAISNAKPLDIDVRSLCSTGSILYARAKAVGLIPTKEVAGCMLSCILSDSLLFRSPTTTETDKKYATELAKIAGIDMYAYGEAMLEAKSDLDHVSAADLVMMDTKIYNSVGKKFRISVVETTHPASLLAKKTELIQQQKNVAKKEQLDDVFLFVVDILAKEAIFISSSASATEIVQKGFACTVGKDGTVNLPGVVSRKKQILPSIENALMNTV